jgi:hypothetical protein
MKTVIPAVALLCATISVSFADGGYWVVGNNQTNRCDIVTSNPVLDVGGPLFFGTGPYNTLKEAKLARSTIGQCPKVEDDKDEEK